MANLTVSVEKADYQPKVEKALKDTAKKASIKGFRPGFAPVQLIQKMYGKSILVDEVFKIINETVSEEIKKNDLNIVGDPLPVDENNTVDFDNTNEPFVFKFEMGFASDFKVDLSNIVVNRNVIDPTAKSIDDAIEDMRKRSPENIKPESSEKGDFVFGKLTQESSEFLKETAFPLDRIKEDAVFKFTGLEIGSKVTFDIQTIFDDAKSLALAVGVSEEEAPNLTGDFDFEVTDITRNALPELSQEFFDKTVGEGKATNIEEYRAEVKNIISENYSRESDFMLNLTIEEAIIEQAKIELPDEHLKKWLFQTNEGKFTMEQIEAEYNIFARNMRLDLINSAIIDENKEELEIKFEDVVEEGRKEIRGYFGSYNYGGMDEFIDKMARDMIKKENKDAQKNLRRFMDSAIKTKVSAFTNTKASVTDRTVSVEEFSDLSKQLSVAISGKELAELED
jgi:trigger factor